MSCSWVWEHQRALEEELGYQQGQEGQEGSPGSKIKPTGRQDAGDPRKAACPRCKTRESNSQQCSQEKYWRLKDLFQKIPLS